MIAYYEQQQNATRIGEQTKGALGNIYEVILEDGSKIFSNYIGGDIRRRAAF